MGGRTDANGMFYVGIKFGNNSKQVHCVEIYSDDLYTGIYRWKMEECMDWRERMSKTSSYYSTMYVNTIVMDYVWQPTISPTTSPPATPSHVATVTSPPVVSLTTPTNCADSLLRFKLFKNNR